MWLLPSMPGWDGGSGLWGLDIVCYAISWLSSTGSRPGKHKATIACIMGMHAMQPGSTRLVYMHQCEDAGVVLQKRLTECVFYPGLPLLQAMWS
jgi:hypothetical protein